MFIKHRSWYVGGFGRRGLGRTGQVGACGAERGDDGEVVGDMDDAAGERDTGRTVVGLEFADLLAHGGEGDRCGRPSGLSEAVHQRR